MKKINVNWKELIERRGLPLVLAATMSVSLAGCGKKAECDIPEDHAHLYVSEEGFSRYLEKEYLEYEGYTRCDDYISINKDDEEFLKFLDKKDLIKIDDNIATIDKIESNNHDYIEYRYAYTYLMPIPHYHSTGKTSYVTYTYMPVTHHSWTTNANHSRLTGEQRRCHHVYQACNVVRDEKGKFVIVPSDYVDSISDLNGEYAYIKEKFCKVIDAEHGYDLDYEDGASDDPENIQEDENQDAQTQSSTQEKSDEKVYTKK